MFSKAIVVLTTLAAFVSAQSTITIRAMISSEGSLVFDPNDVKAAVGDQIQFQFFPGNHSVVRAAFADPCVPIEESSSGNGAAGFFSGFRPAMTTFTVEVEDTNPIWFYCSQSNHCQSGMVGVINANAQDTLADFVSRAAQAPENVTPNQGGGGGGASSTSSSGSTPTMGPSSTAGSSPSITPTEVTTEPSSTAGSSSSSTPAEITTESSSTAGGSPSSTPTEITMEFSSTAGRNSTSTPAKTITEPSGATSTSFTSRPTPTGAASKLGPSIPLVIAAAAASFFLL